MFLIVGLGLIISILVCNKLFSQVVMWHPVKKSCFQVQYILVSFDSRLLGFNFSALCYLSQKKKNFLLSVSDARENEQTAFGLSSKVIVLCIHHFFGLLKACLCMWNFFRLKKAV